MKLKAIHLAQATSICGLATSGAFHVELKQHEGLSLSLRGDVVVATRGDRCELVPLAACKKLEPYEAPKGRGRPKKDG